MCTYMKPCELSKAFSTECTYSTYIKIFCVKHQNLTNFSLIHTHSYSVIMLMFVFISSSCFSNSCACAPVSLHVRQKDSVCIHSERPLRLNAGALNAPSFALQTLFDSNNMEWNIAKKSEDEIQRNFRKSFQRKHSHEN
uniref:Uncharacterized protein n=1 Tax=Glossina palpalis gambiensis TaxID=67801 RepID=A0A1B0BMA0_9MUSC